MDAQSIGEFGSASGTGTVNCQFGVGPWEKFLLLDPPFPTVRWRPAGGSEANPAQDAAAANPKAFQASDYDSDYSALTDTNDIYSPDFGGGTNTAAVDFVATGSVGTSSSLGVSQQVDTEHGQTLAEASSVGSEGTSQDSDRSR
jgi:hypothetical protein